ncbi:MAG TPA: RidA family protein [Thermoanaerobaculaceae bacterium]|nr:RidA family protein [Thermoanaerobaculaceae bacterium]
MTARSSVISTDAAPKAIGPYSQAYEIGGFIYLSGQIPLDPASGAIVEGEFAVQAQRVLDNLDAVLRAAGCRRDQVVKTTVYLTDLGMFAELNQIYAAFFGEHRPARAVVGVAALPRGAKVEIEAVAAR